MVQNKNDIQNDFKSLENSSSTTKTKRKPSTKIKITQRDVEIFMFLDRIGYANLEQITKSFRGKHSETAILTRLYALKKFNYIKTFSTQNGNYYTLLKKAGNKNALINNIKLDQLAHHDYLINLFLITQQHDNNHEILSEREVIAKYKIVGKSGKIPDMVINNWIIEYERTNKSTTDCSAVINYWLYNQNKQVCIIYETEEIKKRYTKLLANNKQIQLVASNNINKLLEIITQRVPEKTIDDVLQNIVLKDNIIIPKKLEIESKYHTNLDKTQDTFKNNKSETYEPYEFHKPYKNPFIN
jgi:hypothetical protein